MNEGNQLQRSSPSKTPKPSDSTAALIREWLFRFGVEYKEDVAPKLPLWLETFGGMDAEKLRPLFERAIKHCRFFPKISEILEPFETAKKAALPEEAILAWEKVLAIRREHFNPDFPQYLTRALVRLPERLQRAARAAGIFQEVSDIDQLHVWGKKRFVESYLAWEEIEENKFLLPEGEVKKLLTNVAEAKALPSSSDWNDLHAKGQTYCAPPASAASSPKPKRRFTPQPSSRSIEEQKAELWRKGFLK